MATVDKHSLTWKAVAEFAQAEREDAIKALIADRDSERQRGALALLERLEALANDPDEPIPAEIYT